MKTTDGVKRINETIKKFDEVAEKAYKDNWTRFDERIRTFTVDGKECVVIG